MAEIPLNIPDELLDRVVNGLAECQGVRSGTRAEKIVAAKKHIFHMIRVAVRDLETAKAQELARSQVTDLTL